MPPTLWEQIVEAGKNASPCPDCKGAGKIQLFSSWEDPCNTCKGRGFLLNASTPNSGKSSPFKEKDLLSFAKDRGFGDVNISLIKHDKGVTNVVMAIGDLHVRGQSRKVGEIYVSSKDLYGDIKLLPSSNKKYGILAYNSTQVFVDERLPDRSIIFIPTGKIDQNIHMPAILWEEE